MPRGNKRQMSWKCAKHLSTQKYFHHIAYPKSSFFFIYIFEIFQNMFDFSKNYFKYHRVLHTLSCIVKK